VKPLRVWWPRSPRPGNLGDVLTPHVLGWLGYDARWASQGSADVLATGSIVRFATGRHTVWGSGAMRATDQPSPRARYLAVRGPLTRKVVLAAGGECPEVYGDPALLLAGFVTCDVPKVHDLGIVPHYVDHGAMTRAHPRERVIDVLRADPLEVVREIRECRSVVSSSLHGIIVAHAFGIPAAWVRWSDRLSGDGIKFRDYAASVGVELHPWSTVEQAAAAPVLGSFDPGPLLQATRGL